MWQTWKPQFLTNLLLIAAIEYIDLPKAGCDLVGSASGLLNTANLGVSKLLEKKLRTVFRRYDHDGDHVITRAEFEGVAETFADKEHFDPVEKEAFRKAFSDLFTLNIEAAGTQGDVPLTEDLFIASRKMQKDNAQYRKAMGDVVLSFSKPMNVQQKGFFNYDEYRRIFESFGFGDVAFAKAGYGLVDANHDGKVSVEEFFDGVIDYMCSDDESSTAVFGLLP